jgi:23S rRNA pseudouridine2605 synthase
VAAGEKMRHVGLARALSKSGHCSRTQGFELVRAGRVRLNGSVTRNPEAPVRLGRDRIEVDGNAVESRKKIYLMLNKPRGVVTTASDEKGRETVYSLLPSEFDWVGPVGRLDKASEGLLLFTNDSEWAAKVMAPASHLEKTYHVQIAAQADEALLSTVSKGVRTKSGEVFAVRRVSRLRAGEKNTWIEIVLDEGKNRHIRRIFEELGIEVLRLVRVAIGSVVLGELAKGAVRSLTTAEELTLDEAMEPGKKLSHEHARPTSPRS